MIEDKEDLRIIKTRTALTNAFLQMLSEMTFEEITVHSLCDRAGVRRATFYKHYEDKNDFLLYVVKLLREGFDSSIWRRGKPDATKEYYVQYVRSLINYLSANIDIVNNILKSDISHTIINIMIQQNYIDTKENLDKSVEEGMQLRASTETCANMLTGGIALIVTKWFEGEKQTPKEELINEISALIDCMLN